VSKKYLFIDLDGTIIDHSTRSIPESTKLAFKLAKQKGHELVIATGRPPCLFYGIDTELDIHSYIAANGRYAVHHDEVILDRPIPHDIVEQVVKYFEQERFDIALEGLDEFVLQSNYSDLFMKFIEAFHLKTPVLKPGFYQNHKIYQINLFYDQPDFKKYQELFPDLEFTYSNEYGIDVNTKGGFKEQGIKAFVEKLGIPIEDCIAFGDGYNDISMFRYVKTSVAMGNAHKEVRDAATFVTDSVNNDGLYKSMKKLGLI
jgi:Cof subfamily protein (haloacid dehalogenase superfamily)